MIIAIFPHHQKKIESINLALAICEYLTTHGVTVVAEEEEARELHVTSLSSIDLEKIDFFLSMGGDGTILNLIHKYPQAHAAILGINLGHLGFMADVPVSDVYSSLQDLILGHYTIDERLCLQGYLPSGVVDFAINDFVVHRGQNPSLVEMAIHVDGAYLNTFLADGLIIATPNGSTAYSLAAGGPILTPNLAAIVITPISPHTISNRPIVLNATAEIQIQYLSHASPLQVSTDGMTHRNLQTGEILKIGPCQKKFRLVCLKRHNYFYTLRTKLSWTGKLR